MNARTRFSAVAGRRPATRLAVASIAIVACISIASLKAYGESIVVEQGNQVARADDVRVNPGDQVVIRNADSKLDLENFLVVEGGTVRLESGGRFNTNTKDGHSRLTERGARALVDGPGSTWTVGGYLEVGDAGEAHLLISNGGKVLSGLVSDNRSRVSGAGLDAPASTATITGPGSLWSAGSDFAVGDSGEAHLIIENGGRLETGLDGHDSRVLGGGELGEPFATATVTGAGSTWITGGRLAFGGTNGVRLLISEGGQITAAGEFALRDNSTLLIETGAKLTASSGFVIGERSSLDIRNASRVESGLDGESSRVTGGGPSGIASKVTIAGAGSLWMVGGTLEIGDSGQAHLVIGEGAVVQSGRNRNRSRVSGGGASAAASTATITGAGSLWDVGSNLEIGDSGQALLVISDGGKVMSGQDGERSRVSGAGGPTEAASMATIEHAGSVWSIGGDFAIGDSGEAHLLIRDGGRVESGGNGKLNRIVGGGGASEGASTATITGAGSTWGSVS
jgi:T5SS/PEP-CTERM-associated repeat protein